MQVSSLPLWVFKQQSYDGDIVEGSQIEGEVLTKVTSKLISWRVVLIFCFSLKVIPIDVIYPQINRGFSKPPLEIMSRNSLLNLCRCPAGGQLNYAGWESKWSVLSYISKKWKAGSLSFGMTNLSCLSCLKYYCSSLAALFFFFKTKKRNISRTWH